jgi:hypothetical protein
VSPVLCKNSVETLALSEDCWVFLGTKLEIYCRIILDATAKHLRMAASDPEVQKVQMADWTKLEATAKHMLMAASGPEVEMANWAILEATAKHLRMASSEPGEEMADWTILLATNKPLQVVASEPGEEMADWTIPEATAKHLQVAASEPGVFRYGRLDHTGGHCQALAGGRIRAWCRYG